MTPYDALLLSFAAVTHSRFHQPARLSPRQIANCLRRRPRWIPVRERLPRPGMVNGFHGSLGVIALARSGATPCYFSFEGGDDLHPGVPPVPSFHTDEGLPLFKVTHWMPLPAVPRRHR